MTIRETSFGNTAMSKLALATSCAALLLLLAGAVVHGNDASDASAVKVTLQNENGSWQLIRDGKPYYVKGAGGASASLEGVAAAGANSNRTWGVGDKTRARLDEAHKNGLTVAVGIWLEHERLEKLDYANADRVEKQAQQVLAHVEALKDHPAVLVWGLAMRWKPMVVTSLFGNTLKMSHVE